MPHSKEENKVAQTLPEENTVIGIMRQKLNNCLKYAQSQRETQRTKRMRKIIYFKNYNNTKEKKIIKKNQTEILELKI